MNPELEHIDNDISFALSCLYQNGHDAIADEISADVKCLLMYIDRIEHQNEELRDEIKQLKA